MKKTLALLVSATALCTVPASSRPDDMGDFDSFMSDALTDFNSFIDEANRDFINFMRNPWKSIRPRSHRNSAPCPSRKPSLCTLRRQTRRNRRTTRPASWKSTKFWT